MSVTTFFSLSPYREGEREREGGRGSQPLRSLSKSLKCRHSAFWASIGTPLPSAARFSPQQWQNLHRRCPPPFLKCLRPRQQCVRFRAPNFQTIHNTHAKPQLLLARNGQSRKGWGNAALMPPLPSNEEPQQANSLKKSEMKVGDITKRADSVSVHTNCPRMAVQNYRAGKMKQQALGRLRSPAVGVEKKKKEWTAHLLSTKWRESPEARQRRKK